MGCSKNQKLIHYQEWGYVTMKLTRNKAAIALICLGCLAMAIALSISKFKVSNLFSNAAEFEKKSYEIVQEEVKSIKVDIENTDVMIIPSTDNMIHVTYFESDEVKYDIEIKPNKVLSITDRHDHNFLNWFGVNLGSRDVYCEIHVPSNLMDKIEVETSNANIDIEYLIITGNLVLRSSNGEIDLNSVTTTNDIKVVTSNGSITADDLKGNVIDFKTSNGEITIDDVNAVDKIIMSTSNASIEFDRIVAGNRIEMTTSNGEVIGSISDSMENYSIESHTSNADNNLKNSTAGSKKLVVRTSNADIEVEFSSN